MTSLPTYQSHQSSIRLAGIGCTRVRSTGVGRAGVRAAGIGCARIGSAGVRSAGIGGARIGRTGVRCARIGRTGVRSAGIGRTGVRAAGRSSLGLLRGLAGAARVIAARPGRARSGRGIGHRRSTCGCHRQAASDHQHLCKRFGIRHFTSPLGDQSIRRDCDKSPIPRRKPGLERRDYPPKTLPSGTFSHAGSACAMKPGMSPSQVFCTASLKLR